MKADGINKITKADIVDSIYNKSKMDRKDVQQVVDSFIEEIKAALVSYKFVELRGFGTFEVKIRKGREKARNPKTGEIVSVDSHGIAYFRAGRELKQDVWTKSGKKLPRKKSISMIEKSLIRSSLVNFAAISIAAFLFAASFPNIIFTNGLPLLAWIAFVPVFWLTSRVGLLVSIFWGAFYGYTAYGLFNYWLSVFHPLAGLIVGSIYMFYLAKLFPLLCLAVKLFPRKGYLIQFLLWMAYEYLRTLGFIAYSYGIAGYSQWNLLPLIQIASITGVWGVSALVVFPSAWLAAALRDYSPRNGLKGLGCCLLSFFKSERLSAIIWFFLLTASLVYGFVSRIDYSDAPTFSVALIQHNTDPWLPSHSPNPLEDYKRDFHILRNLSDEALAAHPDTDLVVWSETAFVPRIWWHTNIRDSRVYWLLVSELLEYLEEHEVPFIIGNDDGRRDPILNPDPRENHQVNFNAAILFERGEITEVYRKLRLVPLPNISLPKTITKDS